MPLTGATATAPSCGPARSGSGAGTGAGAGSGFGLLTTTLRSSTDTLKALSVAVSRMVYSPSGKLVTSTASGRL